MTDIPSEKPKRQKRPPPTIELEAGKPAGAENSWPNLATVWPRQSLLAALGGALAALAVIALLWGAGLLPSREAAAPMAANPAADELAARLGRMETRLAALPTVAGDPALGARVAAVEQSLQALQSLQQSNVQALQGLQRQSEAMTASLNEIRSAPRPAAPAVDLAPLNQRIAELEQSIRALANETAQRRETPAIDAAVGRMFVANQLEAAVRGGTPFAAQLAAAKRASGDAGVLAALEAFAATGVPDDASLARELIALLAQLDPKPAEAPAGLLDRLEANAARLVRIRPAGESAGDDVASLVQRISAAARRNDVATARRELGRLDAARRAPAEAWIKRHDARETARATAADFTAQALAALPKP